MRDRNGKAGKNSRVRRRRARPLLAASAGLGALVVGGGCGGGMMGSIAPDAGFNEANKREAPPVGVLARDGGRVMPEAPVAGIVVLDAGKDR